MKTNHDLATTPADGAPDCSAPEGPRTAADSIRCFRSDGPSSRKGRWLVWARRLSQIGFFMLFLVLLVQTEYRARYTSSSGQDEALGVSIQAPVSIFLEADPLVAVGTAASTRTLYPKLLLSLVIIIPTLLLGRFFCGWICPMGALNHWISELRPRLTGRRRLERNSYRGRMRLKTYLLVASLLAALLGSAQFGLLDPISLMVRSLGLAIIPALNYLLGWGFNLLASTGLGFLENVAGGGHSVRSYLLTGKDPIILGAWLIGSLFIVILALNRIVTRFWCRYLCPLGALLGVFARFSLFGMNKKHEQCTGCGLCKLHCQGADHPEGGERWRAAECHMCFNCEGSCPEGVISFGFLPRRADIESGTDTTRRSLLVSAAAGLSAIGLARVSAGSGFDFHERRIRPPGSCSEAEFLARCIKCGQCMKVCPNNALHPAITQAGLEGFWSPVLIPRIGYCESTCTLCSQVCPTGAIAAISAVERLGGEGGEPIRLGTAFYDHGRCLPWSMGIPCIVCEEWCPVSPKAIWLEEVQVTTREGSSLVSLQRPHLDPAACIGCGACEHACPLQDLPAVRVTSVNESRDPQNRLLLRSRSRDEID